MDGTYTHKHDPDDQSLSDTQVIIYITCFCGLTLFAGLMSGLTLGLMSLDNVELEVLRQSGTPSQRRCAAIIQPLVKNHNFLLVTLLVCNASATETLPLFIDRLADPFTAVILSVTVVLAFGEVLPQAVCSRYGLEVGARCAWFVRLLMILCSPISYPVGKLLDVVIGTHHSELFRRSQLMALVDVHGSMAGFGGSLTEAEVLVIRGALDLTAKTASKSMTPLDKVFMLSTEDRLDERTIEAILISGHSRIPVYKDRNRSNIVGLIMIKEMVLVDPSEQLPVSSLSIRELPQLPADTPMYDMLKVFQAGKSHMALLMRPKYARTSATHVMSNEVADEEAVSWGRRSKTPLSNEPQEEKSQGVFSSTMTALGSLLGRQPSLAPPTEDEEAGLLSRQSSSLTFSRDPLPETAQWSHELEPVGIITIEDVIEELLQQEIIDETDQYIDNNQTSHVDNLLLAQGLPPRLQHYITTGMFQPRMTLLGARQRMTAAPLKDMASALAYEHACLPSQQSQADQAEAKARDAEVIDVALTTLTGAGPHNTVTTATPSSSSPIRTRTPNFPYSNSRTNTPSKAGTSANVSPFAATATASLSVHPTPSATAPAASSSQQPPSLCSDGTQQQGVSGDASTGREGSSGNGKHINYANAPDEWYVRKSGRGKNSPVLSRSIAQPPDPSGSPPRDEDTGS